MEIYVRLTLSTEPGKFERLTSVEKEFMFDSVCLVASNMSRVAKEDISLIRNNAQREIRAIRREVEALTSEYVIVAFNVTPSSDFVQNSLLLGKDLTGDRNQSKVISSKFTAILMVSNGSEFLRQFSIRTFENPNVSAVISESSTVTFVATTSFLFTSSSPTPTFGPSSSPKKPRDLAFVGYIIGSVVLVALSIVIIWKCRKIRKSQIQVDIKFEDIREEDNARNIDNDYHNTEVCLPKHKAEIYAC